MGTVHRYFPGDPFLTILAAIFVTVCYPTGVRAALVLTVDRGELTMERFVIQ